MNVLRSASFLLVPALFLACSASNNGTGGGGSDTPCGHYYNAITAFAQRCGQTTGFEGESTAAARFETTCNNVLSAPGIANGLGQIDACATKFASLACNQDAGCTLSGGTLATGAACEETSQCAGYCKKAASSSTGATACGTCAPTTALGAACTADDECGINVACELSGTGTGTCVAIPTTTKPAPVAIGAACQDSTDCDASQAECKGGKCAALPAAGEACDGSCAQGLGCGQDKKCAAYTFVSAGASCDLVHRCQDSLCIGSSVTVTSGTDGTSTTTITPGTCKVPLADGAACSETDEQNHCDAFASCIAGTCQIENPSACK